MIDAKALNEKGLKAAEWAGVVSDKVGGKKGGNEGAAQGAGSEIDKVEEALALADAFAKKLIL